MTAKSRALSDVDRLIDRTLKSVSGEGAEKIKRWKRPGGDMRRLVKCDYVRGLRKGLTYSQVKALEVAFDQIFPGFNSQPIGMKSISGFTKIATNLRFHLKASPYTGSAGLALRGFYVAPSCEILKRPLIYVNTAHHPLAVSATFCHELGHHVSSELFGASGQAVHFFFDADYLSHLEDPPELAADVVVSLAGYPKAIAQRIFETPWNWGLVARAKNLTDAALNEVRVHLRQVYGFDLMERLPASQRLHYLSGMIHYAKLRWALLAEYDL
jgi:hypothetical protein